MNGKRIYIAFLISMALIAALGLWALVDSAIAYRQRPRVEDAIGSPGIISLSDPIIHEGGGIA